MKRFSVVIPAYNEELYLPLTLAAVKRAETALGNPVEVIVADNVSTDRTAAVAQSFGARVVQTDIRCISAVRNCGAAAATADYLVFVDADDRMSENLLIEVQRVMDSGRFVGGGVAQTRYDRHTWGIRLTHGLVQTALSFTGLSMFLFYTTTEANAAIGGFDESLLCTEDYDYAKRLRTYGRQFGLKYKNLRSAHLVKSSRKFTEYGDWGIVTHPILAIKAALRNPAAAQELWYGERRQTSSQPDNWEPAPRALTDDDIARPAAVGER